jgi:Flp pilus assembly pilin Flp
VWYEWPILIWAASAVNKKLNKEFRVGQSLPGYQVMRNIITQLHLLVSDRRAQDTVEYALLMGFVAVAIGAVMPDISEQVDEIFRRLCELMKSTPKA